MPSRKKTKKRTSRKKGKTLRKKRTAYPQIKSGLT